MENSDVDQNVNRKLYKIIIIHVKHNTTAGRN